MSSEVRILLEAIVSNFNIVRTCLNNSNIKICASVKANAYGHGLQEVVSTLHKKHQVDYWGVATLDEALQVRNIIPYANILCYCQLSKHALATAITHNIELCAGDEEYLKAIVALASIQHTKAKIHLMIETGMGRLGVSPEAFSTVFTRYSQSSYCTIQGICSHLSNSSDDATTKTQQIIFDNALSQITIPKDCIIHIANSGAILWNKEEPRNKIYYTMVRPGIMLYGASPNPQRTLPKDIVLAPAMKLIGRVASVQRYPEGQGISYMSNFVCNKDTNIAVVNMGYGDGLPRALSNCGIVAINNKRYPIVGNVCMDMCMINLDDDHVDIGSEVVFFSNAIINIDEQATLANTISYELTTRIAPRVKKQYYYNNLTFNKYSL